MTLAKARGSEEEWDEGEGACREEGAQTQIGTKLEGAAQVGRGEGRKGSRKKRGTGTEEWQIQEKDTLLAKLPHGHPMCKWRSERNER